MNLNENIQTQLLDQLTSADISSEQLNNALRLLGKWRSVLIQNTLLKHHGTIVMQGPLSGLEFINQSAEGCHIAKILGCYEQRLKWFPRLVQQPVASRPVASNLGMAKRRNTLACDECAEKKMLRSLNCGLCSFVQLSTSHVMITWSDRPPPSQLLRDRLPAMQRPLDFVLQV